MSATAAYPTDGLATGLPVVEPDAARRARLMADRRLPAWLARCLAGPARIGCGGPLAGTVLLRVQLGAGALELVAEATALPALAMAAALQDRVLAREVGQALLAPWLQRLAPDLPDLVLTELRACAEAGADHTVHGGDVRMGVLAVDSAAAAHLTALLQRQPSPPGPGFLPLRVRGRVRLFARQFSMDDLGSLAPGDIVLDQAGRDANRPWRAQALFGTEFVMQAEVDIPPEAATATLVQAPALQAEHADPAGPDLQRLGELGLPVAFEIDTACISLNELAALDAGSVVELHAPLLDAPVRLVCFGQVVGLGQLVAVGERLGVRIQRMGVQAATGRER